MMKRTTLEGEGRDGQQGVGAGAPRTVSTLYLSYPGDESTSFFAIPPPINCTTLVCCFTEPSDLLVGYLLSISWP